MEGKSGCSGHSDWPGYGHDIECKDEYPDFLKKIITFRNATIRKEWMGSLEHDVSGKTVEECMEKSIELSRRVQARLDEITARYKPFDQSIEYMVLLFVVTDNFEWPDYINF